MVKACVESQKSGKQKGCGKRDRGKEKKPNEEEQCKREGNALASMQQTHI